MLRKVSFLLTVVLTLLMVAPVFAQEPEAASQRVFLPVVAGGGLVADAQDEVNDEPNLTDTLDAVEASGSDAAGMVFVATNAMDPIRGNEIVMYRRDGNGQLTVTGRFPSGGQGLGSGLGSQNSLLLSDNGQWLFAVNAGSNEISVFAVEKAGLILTDKVASGGVRPTSLTVRKNVLYVLNAGDPGNITAFGLNKLGKLAALANSTRFLSNNGSGAAPAPAQVSFTPDGRHLVVSERSSNLIDLYKIDKNGLATGPTSFNSSGVTPFGFAFGKDGTLIVSEAFGGAVNGSAVSSYRIQGDQLQLLSGSVATGQTAACWIITSKDGRYGYSTNAGSASLSGYRVENDGRITLLNGRAGDTGTGTGPTDAAVSHNGRWAYVLSPRSQTVVAFMMQADGSLVPAGSFGGLQTGPAGIAAW
ncbi:MAG: beta-propeller fold lactonase family protein [Caldilineaceae bacterium]